MQSEYWISELAALAGVSARTIRYYIQEGILPQPEIRGKYAVFTDEDRNRLKLIQRFKEAYLPLNRIRELLNELDDRQIVSLLEEFDQDPVSALSSLQALPVLKQPPGQPNPTLSLDKATFREGSAVEYIQQLRGKKQIHEESPSLYPYVFPSPADSSLPPTEEWQRLILAPGLELHVRQPVSPRLQQWIDQILRLVKQDKP